MSWHNQSGDPGNGQSSVDRWLTGVGIGLLHVFENVSRRLNSGQPTGLTGSLPAANNG